MDEWKDKGNNKRYLLWFMVLWVVQMAAAFWFCTQKQGFHEDEYYTYYSTARTNGFYVEDGRWMTRDAWRDEFVVLPGERFRYGLVRQVQSWDVHPPMYYWVFHTAASFAPGVFSKWIGLAVNLFFHGINLVLLTALSCLATGGDRGLSLLVTFVYGFGPAALSGVVFIRMYEMLTTFVLLCAILHLQAVGRGEEKLSFGKSLLPMAAVTYFGFLTHYYYFLFLFFLAAAFCVWLLWRDRKIGNCLRYGISQGIAFGLAYLTYPAFPGQMFRGQRGAQAAENFFDAANTFDRVAFFLRLMDRYVFGRILFWLVLFLVCLPGAIFFVRKKRGHSGFEKREKKTGFGAAFFLLLFAAAGYFGAVSKTALLLGETSVRYQLPIYGIVVLLLFFSAKSLWQRALGKPGGPGENRLGGLAFGLGLVLLGHLGADVVFLYPEDQEQVSFAVQRAAEGAPVAYLYRPGEEWCIWDVANELMAYPAVYFAAADSGEPLADDRIGSAEELVVYIAKGADPREQLARFPGKDGMPVQDGLVLMFEEKYCDVYYLRRGRR